MWPMGLLLCVVSGQDCTDYLPSCLADNFLAYDVLVAVAKLW